MSEHFAGSRYLHLHGMRVVSTGSDNDAIAGYVTMVHAFVFPKWRTSCQAMRPVASYTGLAVCCCLLSNEQPALLTLHLRSQTASHFAVNLRALHTLPAHQKMRTATAIARNESSSGLATRAPLRDYIRECLWGGERTAPLACRKDSSNMQTVT
jgi:hypothetical protein